MLLTFSCLQLLSCTMLKDNPNDELRAFVIYKYRIIYQIKEAIKEIRVIRISHTSR